MLLYIIHRYLTLLCLEFNIRINKSDLILNSTHCDICIKPVTRIMIAYYLEFFDPFGTHFNKYWYLLKYMTSLEHI